MNYRRGKTGGRRRAKTISIVLCVGLLSATGFTPINAQSPNDLFENGRTLVEDGDWREALDVWASMPDAFIGTGTSDPRVGPAFLATAVEHNAEDRFSEGTTLYLWGFSGPNLEERREDVEREAMRIVPLLSRRDSVQWMPVLNGPTKDLTLRIARFWLEHDPTPGSAVNERLVEHWQRIVTARDKYQYNRSSVYETDDRGLIFVKYGPPGTRTRGSLGASEMELKIRIPDDATARETLRRLDPSPQFELWKYAGLTPEEFTYYLFGNVRGTGPFELVKGPLDLIGDAARSLSSASNTPGGARAQHYLELFYYRDLAVLGGHFGRRFDQLSDLWDGFTMRRNVFGGGGRAPSESTLESFSYRFAEQDKFDPPGVPTISIRSNYEGSARGVEMVVQAVRILDTSDQPMLVIQGLSAPRMRLSDRDRRSRYRSALRDTEHTLVVRDRELVQAGQVAQLAPAAGGGISVFHLRHPPQPMHLTLIARPIGDPITTGDTLSLVGQGHAYVEEPLTGDPAVFEVSDISVGTPWDAAPGSTSSLPFPLLPGSTIWTGDALRVYIELYHLRTDVDDVGLYGLDFRLLPLDDVGEVRSSPEPVTLGIQLESDGPRAQRHFDIGLAGLEPGFYRLKVDATDLLIGSTITRVSQIEIIG